VLRASPLLLSLSLLAACASSIPKAELDRCKLGVADGNDAYMVRQAAACGLIARHLADDQQIAAAIPYARKACQLEDAHGCEEYLTLVHERPTLGPDELSHARAAGEKACDGMVVAADGTDARPGLCEETAELFELDPPSPKDAGRFYARACKLGNDRGCTSAKRLGASVETEEAPPPAKATKAPPPPPMPAIPPPRPPIQLPPAPPRASTSIVEASCHEMRDCVTLELRQRNITEVVGTMTSRCGQPVLCKWCPAKQQQVDKNACHTATLQPGDSKSGQEGGLWYDGYDSMGYDCMAVGDSPACMGI
jgi:hypothetical protein